MSSGPKFQITITDGYKVDEKECERIFSTHSYLGPPYWRTTVVMTLLLVWDGKSLPIYHVGIGYHHPSHTKVGASHGTHPMDDVYQYFKDGKRAIMLARLVSGKAEASIRSLADIFGGGRQLEQLKTRLLCAAIQYAFENMNAGIVVDYIDKADVQNMEEARNLVHKVCNKIHADVKLRDTGKYYATYWPHSKYLR